MKKDRRNTRAWCVLILQIWTLKWARSLPLLFWHYIYCSCTPQPKAPHLGNICSVNQQSRTELAKLRWCAFSSLYWEVKPRQTKQKGHGLFFLSKPCREPGWTRTGVRRHNCGQVTLGKSVSFWHLRFHSLNDLILQWKVFTEALWSGLSLVHEEYTEIRNARSLLIWCL